MNKYPVYTHFDRFSLQIEEPKDIISYNNDIITPSASPPYLDYTRSPSIVTPDLRESKPNSKHNYDKIFSFEFTNNDLSLDLMHSNSTSGGPMITPESRPSTWHNYQKQFSLFNAEENNLLSSGARSSVPLSECANENAEYNEQIIITQNDMDDLLNEINNIEIMHNAERSQFKQQINQLNISNNILNTNISKQYKQLNECENIIAKYSRIINYFNDKYNENINIYNFDKIVKLQNTNRNSLVQNNSDIIQEEGGYLSDYSDEQEVLSDAAVLEEDIDTLRNYKEVSLIDEQKDDISETELFTEYSSDSKDFYGDEQEDDISDTELFTEYSSDDQHSTDVAVLPVEEEIDALIFVSDYNINYKKQELHNETCFDKSIDDPFEWNLVALSKWLKQNGLKKYRKTFQQNGINGERLLIDLNFKNLVINLEMELEDAKKLIDLAQELRLKSEKYVDFVIDNEMFDDEYESDSLIDYEDQFEFDLLYLRRKYC